MTIEQIGVEGVGLQSAGVARRRRLSRSGSRSSPDPTSGVSSLVRSAMRRTSNFYPTSLSFTRDGSQFRDFKFVLSHLIRG